MWARYVNLEIDYYEAVRKRFMTMNRINGEEIPEYLKYEWRKVIVETPRLRAVPPKRQDHQGEIAFDIFGWPLSLLWFVLVKLYGLLVTRIEYNKIGEKRIEKIVNELKG